MKSNGERIEQIISKFCKSKADFARKVGERPQTINNWITRDNGMSVINKIIEAFPELNTAWLLTGEGEMLNKSNENKEKAEAPAAPSYTTYLLPMSAMGGSLTGFAAPGAELKDCELVVSPIEDVDFAITISGESMAPEFPSGSRILIKKVDPGLFIEWGKAYVLDTPNGVIIKEVLRCAREGYITCHSINPDPKFADFDVPLSEVYGMYRVLMCMAAK